MEKIFKVIFIILIAVNYCSALQRNFISKNSMVERPSLSRMIATRLASFIERNFPIRYDTSDPDNDGDNDELTNTNGDDTIIIYNNRTNQSEEYDIDITNCNSLSDINEYFFEIYASGNGNISDYDLEDMLKFQLKRISKNKQRNDRRRKKKCSRERCILSQELLKIAKVDYVNRENFATVCPIMLYNLELENCDMREDAKILSRSTG